MALFAALIDPIDQLMGHADPHLDHADREACVALLERHTCELYRRAYCPRGLKEKALLLLYSLLTSAQLPAAGLQ